MEFVLEDGQVISAPSRKVGGGSKGSKYANFFALLDGLKPGGAKVVTDKEMVLLPLGEKESQQDNLERSVKNLQGYANWHSGKVAKENGTPKIGYCVFLRDNVVYAGNTEKPVAKVEAAPETAAQA